MTWNAGARRITALATPGPEHGERCASKFTYLCPVMRLRGRSLAVTQMAGGCRVSSHLSFEITKLAADARHHGVHHHSLIKELTMVVGYAHMLEVHPQSRNISAVRRHLQAFSDLACAHEYI